MIIQCSGILELNTITVIVITYFVFLLFCSSNKENEERPGNYAELNDNELKNKEMKTIGVKMVNGDCHIKEELEVFDEVESLMVSIGTLVSTDLGYM